MTKVVTSSGSVYHVKHVTAIVRDEAGNEANFGQVVNYMDILSLRVRELEAELEDYNQGFIALSGMVEG